MHGTSVIPGCRCGASAEAARAHRGLLLRIVPATAKLTLHKRVRNEWMLHSSGKLDSSYFDQCLQPWFYSLKRTRLTTRIGP
mgnify:CR=1 FL=1